MKYKHLVPGTHLLPQQYFSYLFLRFPGQAGPKTRHALTFYDSRDLRLSRQGLACIGSLEASWLTALPTWPDQGHSPLPPGGFWPAELPGIEAPARLGKQKLVPLFKAVCHRSEITFANPKGPEVKATLLHLGKDLVFSLPLVAPNLTKPLLEAMEADGWQTTSSWYFNLLSNKGLASVLQTYQPVAWTDTSPAGPTLVQILRQTLEQARHQIPGITKDEDPEALHQFRILLRKATSLLSALKPLTTAEWYIEVRSRLSTLLNLTGPLRDLDVQLAGWPPQKAALPEGLRPAADPWENLMRSRQMQAGLKTRNWVKSPACAQVFGQLATLLQTGQTAFHEVDLSVHFWQQQAEDLKKIRSKARQLGPLSPEEHFHDLRKSLKKIRYLWETFTGLFQVGRGDLLAALKLLQEDFGRFQDLCIRRDHLQAWSPNNLEQAQAAGFLAGLNHEKLSLARQACLDSLKGPEWTLLVKHHKVVKARMKPDV